MLPSAVNSHTESNKYQYMFVEKPLYNNTTCCSVYLQKGKHHVVTELLIRKTLLSTYLYDLQVGHSYFEHC